MDDIIDRCPASNGTVSVNGVKLAGVQRITECERATSRAVYGIGDNTPSAIVNCGRIYEIIIEREIFLGDGVSFDTRESFSLQAGGNIYDGCIATGVERTALADGSVSERISISAPRRREVK